MPTPSVDATTDATTDGPVDRALRVLQTVVAADEALGVREIGRRCGLAHSTAGRIVTNLTRLNMVERTASGAVLPGSALATLQRPTHLTGDPLLRDQLRPLLAELVQTFGENAALAVDDGEAMLYRAQVRSDNPVSAPDIAGERHPFHLVAPGLLAMAWWDDSRFDQWLTGPLDPATEFSLTDPAALRAHRSQVQATGWAWADQGLDLGVNGLAVPVVDDDDQLLITVSLYGPSYRFSPETNPDLGATLKDLVIARAAALISS